MDAARLPEALRERCEELERSFDAEVDRLAKIEVTFGDPKTYVEKVLPTELERLRHVTSSPQDVDLLVLLCGTSPQPLLVSAGFVAPPRVMLVGSDTPEGHRSVNQVAGFLQELERQNKNELSIRRMKPLYIAPSDPVEAYRDLARGVRAVCAQQEIPFDRVLVDITGGKKTMVAAAFLVCSELGLQSAYVDADYDGKARLPRPCTTQFALLSDPIGAFRVRELRRVVELTRQSMYDAASQLLKELVAFDLGISPEVLERDLVRLEYLSAWSSRRFDALPNAPEPLASFAREWASHQNPSRRWSLDACAKAKKCALLTRFALHQTVHGRRLYERRRQHDGFLTAFAACDALADGLVTTMLTHGLVECDGVDSHSKLKRVVRDPSVIAQILCEATGPADNKVRVSRKWPGLGRRVFDEALGHDTVRPVRNTLMHRIGHADEGVIRTFFDSHAPDRFISAVEHALGRRDFDVEAEKRRIIAAIDELEHMEISEAFEERVHG